MKGHLPSRVCGVFPTFYRVAAAATVRPHVAARPAASPSRSSSCCPPVAEKPSFVLNLWLPPGLDTSSPGTDRAPLALDLASQPQIEGAQSSAALPHGRAADQRHLATISLLLCRATASSSCDRLLICRRRGDVPITRHGPASAAAADTSPSAVLRSDARSSRSSSR